ASNLPFTSRRANAKRLSRCATRDSSNSLEAPQKSGGRFTAEVYRVGRGGGRRRTVSLQNLQLTFINRYVIARYPFSTPIKVRSSLVAGGNTRSSCLTNARCSFSTPRIVRYSNVSCSDQPVFSPF